MSDAQMPVGPSPEAPAPLSPGLAEAGGECGEGSRHGKAGHGKGAERRGSMRADDPWSNGSQPDPWARYGSFPGQVSATRVRVNVPVPPSTPSSSEMVRERGEREGFAVPPGLATVPNMSALYRGSVSKQAVGVEVAGQAYDNVTGARQLIGRMNEQELRAVFMDLSQRLKQQSGQFVPERLGQSPPDPRVPAFARPEGALTLPISSASHEQGRGDDRDVFSRSEKWLGSPPSPEHASWKGREGEVLGMNAYIHELVAWANQASVEFGKEIAQAARWPTQIAWNSLTKSQQARGVRLFSVLKAAFSDHGRITLMIQSFGEGLDIVAVAMQGDMFGNSLAYMGNGFELLRQLVREFSLRSRAEAMSLRAMLMARTFQTQSGTSAPVADTVRQIEIAVARYLRLLSTLEPGDAVGLGLTDSDQLTLLIRSLPDHARAYTLHHSQGETYGSYRASALRWEQQQRLFMELHGHGAKHVFGLHTEEAREHSDTLNVAENEWGGQLLAAKGGAKGTDMERCGRCGKQGHATSQCSVSLAKTKCFKCGEFGHISVNCSKSKDTDARAVVGPKGSASPKGSGLPKGSAERLFSPKKGSSFSKGKGKGQGGKKGKLFAMFDEESGMWWYAEAGGDETLEEPCGEPTSAEPSAETVLLLSSLLSAERNEPNTRFEHVLACIESVPALVLCQPLLQSVQETLGSEYWLLDSGASSCVVTRKSLEQLHHDEIVPCGALFTAANGAPVPFLGRCSVVLRVRTRNEKGVIKDGVCKVPVMVGDTPYNILSTRALGRLGWRVVLDEGVHVSHVRTPVEMIVTCIWCDTPWIKVLDSSGHDQMLTLFEEGVYEQDVATSASVGHVAVLSRRTQEELEVHRTKGHVPFHPDCEHCVKSREVNRHRRRLEHGLETEIVADFMYLSAAGESISVVERQSGDTMKILVLREAFSSSVGAIVMTEDLSKDRSLLNKWLAEFGLSASVVSISLLTDAEEAVKSFVVGSSDKFTFLVRKAAPQAHEQIGGAERTVRMLKEGLATLQSDFQSLGYVLVFRRDLMQLALTYLCMSVNVNGKAFGGDRAPKEIAVGRRLPEAVFALFGTKVLAEVPDSVKCLCPNMSRFVTAAFLHPQFGSLGNLVFAYVRVGQELVPKAFVARSIKLVYPIEVLFESGMFSVLKVKGEQGPSAVRGDCCAENSPWFSRRFTEMPCVRSAKGDL